MHAPPFPLHTMNSPWPFAVWGMDVIGQIHPKASNGHRFILVVIDYFTKWMEASSYANITRATVCKFLKKEIICRYGLPERIITDNASNLNNQMIADVRRQFKITHHNSTTYQPKMNEAVEAAKKISRGSYLRQPIPSRIGMKNYLLPIEVEITSLWILNEVQLDEAEWVQARFDQLNLIEERRLKAICHGQMYQKRMMRAYNKKVRPREFKAGDIILKRISPNIRYDREKWMPNWEGPYVVKKAFSGGALILTKMDGEELKNQINADAVKKYYA
ncbi:hypothetical protein V6N13_005085 [Hibiscus sabdariffa]